MWVQEATDEDDSGDVADHLQATPPTRFRACLGFQNSS